MKYVKLFEDFGAQERPPRPTKALDKMGKYRKYRDDRYVNELLPLFRHLNQQYTDLRLPEWFEKVQQEDDVFYSKVQSEDIAQPDIRELWRDLTSRPMSKYQHILNPNRGVI